MVEQKSVVAALKHKRTKKIIEKRETNIQRRILLNCFLLNASIKVHYDAMKSAEPTRFIYLEKWFSLRITFCIQRNCNVIWCENLFSSKKKKLNENVMIIRKNTNLNLKEKKKTWKVMKIMKIMKINSKDIKFKVEAIRQWVGWKIFNRIQSYSVNVHPEWHLFMRLLQMVIQLQNLHFDWIQAPFVLILLFVSWSMRFSSNKRTFIFIFISMSILMRHNTCAHFKLIANSFHIARLSNESRISLSFVISLAICFFFFAFSMNDKGENEKINCINFK